MLMPKIAAATMNNGKLETATAYAASSADAAADSDASAEPSLRPIARIRSVAGTVVAATLIIMTDTGSVASAWLPASPEPIIPPSVTSTMAPVAEINWQLMRIDRLRLAISAAFSHISARIIAACSGSTTTFPSPWPR